MAIIKLKGNQIHTSGELPKVGSEMKNFTYVKNDLSEASLNDIESKYKILNIFPSIDTGTCAMSVRQFNQRMATHSDATVLCLSQDLPFAIGRFCGAEGLDKVVTGSLFRSQFAKDYGLDITDGPLKGLCSRVVIILDNENKILYTEQVADIVNEPNYEKAFEVLK